LTRGEEKGKRGNPKKSILSAAAPSPLKKQKPKSTLRAAAAGSLLKNREPELPYPNESFGGFLLPQPFHLPPTSERVGPFSLSLPVEAALLFWPKQERAKVPRSSTHCPHYHLSQNQRPRPIFPIFHRPFPLWTVSPHCFLSFFFLFEPVRHPAITPPAASSPGHIFPTSQNPFLLWFASHSKNQPRPHPH